MRVSFNTIKFVWFPRMLMIAFIILFSMFSLDAFSGDAPFLNKLAGFLIHMMPSFLILLFLVVTWNRPLLAGFIFILLSIAFTLFFKSYQDPVRFLIISMIPAVNGFLFLLPSLIRRMRSA